MTLADNSSLQIASLAEPESESRSWRRLHHNFGGRTCQNRCRAVLPGDETSQGQAVVIATRVPDPIHPQTIVGQSIDDLGTSLGLPDFERNDADVDLAVPAGGCVTDFYLYLNGDDYVVTGWAWRPPLINQTMDEESCQQQIGTLLDANA